MPIGNYSFMTDWGNVDVPEFTPKYQDTSYSVTIDPQMQALNNLKVPEFNLGSWFGGTGAGNVPSWNLALGGFNSLLNLGMGLYNLNQQKKLANAQLGAMTKTYNDNIQLANAANLGRLNALVSGAGNNPEAIAKYQEVADARMLTPMKTPKV